MKKICTLLALGFAGTLHAQTADPLPYCNADFDDPAPINANALKTVTLGTLNNNSIGQYTFPHYVYYSNLAVPDLAAGTPLPMTLAFNVVGNSGWGVWIDFNHNNAFDAGEKIAGSDTTTALTVGANTTVTTTVTIPTTALNGNTRMRVRIVEDDSYTSSPNGYAIMPCNAGPTPADVMDWGETEDYQVNITGGTNGTTPPPSSNGLDFSANRTVGFTNTNFTLSDNNFKNPTARRWVFIPNKVIYQAATTESSARPIVRFTDTGTYTVKLVTTFAGGKDSAERSNYIRINPFPSGIAAVETAAFEVFPNPATGIVNFTQPLQNADLTVMGVTGVTVHRVVPFSGANLDMSAFADGVYFLRITQAGETFMQKVVLQK